MGLYKKPECFHIPALSGETYPPPGEQVCKGNIII